MPDVSMPDDDCYIDRHGEVRGVPPGMTKVLACVEGCEGSRQLWVCLLACGCHETRPQQTFGRLAPLYLRCITHGSRQELEAPDARP